MQLLWICVALCATVLSCTEGRYTPKWHQKRGLRMYSNGLHHERGLRMYNGLKGGYRKKYNKPVDEKILQLQQFEQLTGSGDGSSGDGGSGDGTYVDADGDSQGYGLGDGVVPFDPSEIGAGIEPEVHPTVRVPTVQYVPQLTTVRPQPRTQKPDNYWGFWNNVASAVGDISNHLGDVASNVGDTVGDWGESVGDTFNDLGENVVDWGEDVGETFNGWGDDISNTLDNWGDTLSGRANDIYGNIGDTFDEAHVQVMQAQIELIEAAKAAGEKLKQTFQDAREGLPTLRDQVVDSLRHFGILVSNGAEYVCSKITQITDQVHSSDIIQKIKDALEKGDEKVAEFLQLIGHKMETWFQSHTQLTWQADVFQDSQIQGELQALVNHGILTAYDVTVLTETSQISSKLKQLMERGDPSVTELIQLLEQKIARWSEDTEGGITQIQQQLPAFFQDYEIQEELKELVEQGILTSRDVTMLTESTSVISKLEQALESGDDRVTMIMTLMAEREAVLEQQQSQRVAEIIPNIFQDDEVQEDLQKLVDAGVFTEEDFHILTQQQSQKGVINIEKRKYSQRGWFDSLGDTFNDLGDAIGDTASKVGEWGSQAADQVVDAASDVGDKVSDWGSQAADQVVDAASDVGDKVSEWGTDVAEFAVDAADQVVDVAAGAKDAVLDAQYDKRYVFPKNMAIRGRRGWFDSIGDTFDGWGDTLSKWGGHVADFAEDAADKVADVAGDAKDVLVEKFQKREFLESDIRK